jgi:hypothetical protein
LRTIMVLQTYGAHTQCQEHLGASDNKKSRHVQSFPYNFLWIRYDVVS